MIPDPSPADVQALTDVPVEVDWEHAAREALAQLDWLRTVGDALADAMEDEMWLGDVECAGCAAALAVWRDAMSSELPQGAP